MDHKYCVYLTMYKGELLPKWYIGSSTIQKVKNGYNGTILSKKWYNIYQNEQKENKHLFKTRILSTHETRKQALEEELRVQKLHSVRDNSKYFNESYATVNGFFGKKLNELERKIASENSKNKVTCYNKETLEFMQVSKEEFDNNDNLVGVNYGKKFNHGKNKNKVMAKCLMTGKILKVSKEEFDSNDNLVGSTTGRDVSNAKGTMVIIDELGNTKRINKENFDSDKHKHLRSGKTTVKDKDGNIFVIETTDERFISGELVGFNKGKKFGDEFAKKISETRILNGNSKGSKNPRAKIVVIFNNQDEPIYFCHGNFGEVCKAHGLSSTLLSKTYKNNTKAYDDITEEYLKNSKKWIITKLLKSEFYKNYKGWYARIMERIEI